MGADKNPLKGIRILVTRARPQAAEFSHLLRRQGATVVRIPLIEIVPPRSFQPLDDALENLHCYQWLIVTSVNGAQAMLERMRRRKISRAKVKNLAVVAIGPATRKALETAGLRVAITPPEYVAESLVVVLSNKVRGKRVLLMRAAVARDVIPRRLRRAGAKVDVVAAYQTRQPVRSGDRMRQVLADRKSRPQVATFTSSSTVHHFVRASRGASLDGLALASIGPITSATLRSYGLRPAMEAESYTMAGLARAIVKWAQEQDQGLAAG